MRVLLYSFILFAAYLLYILFMAYPADCDAYGVVQYQHKCKVADAMRHIKGYTGNPPCKTCLQGFLYRLGLCEEYDLFGLL